MADQNFDTEMSAGVGKEVTIDPDESAQPEVSTTEELYTWIVFYSLCIILTLVLNSVLLIGLTKRKNGFKKNQLDVYLTSLIVARMFIAALVIPARITGLFSEEYLGSILCKLCHYVGVASGATSIFSTTTIAVLKYYDIVISKESHIFKDKPAVGVVIIWLLGYAYAIRTPIIFDLSVVQEGNSTGLWLCNLSPDYKSVGMDFVYVDLVFLFIVPACILSFCYSKVVKKLALDQNTTRMASSKASLKKLQVGTLLSDVDNNPRKQKPKLAFEEKQTQPGSEQSKPLSPAQQRTVMSVVVWVAVLFFACSSMTYGLWMYTHWFGTAMEDLGSTETILYFISYSNAWMNAIVLLRFRADIRSAAVTYMFGDSKVHSSEKDVPKEDNTFGLG